MLNFIDFLFIFAKFLTNNGDISEIARCTQIYLFFGNAHLWPNLLQISPLMAQTTRSSDEFWHIVTSFKGREGKVERSCGHGEDNVNNSNV